MAKNSIVDPTGACWNVLRCSSLEGFKSQLPLDEYTNSPYRIETIATAMFMLPPGALQHRDPADVDAVFGALKRLGAMSKSDTDTRTQQLWNKHQQMEANMEAKMFDVAMEDAAANAAID